MVDILDRELRLKSKYQVTDFKVRQDESWMEVRSQFIVVE
jgi:hypothetical protein